LDVRLLDHRGQRLLRHPARLEEAGEVGPSAQARNAKFHRARARLPVTLAVAVALHQPLGALLAVAGAGQAANLQLHQPLGSKADHLAQEVGVRGLLHLGTKAHHRVGHRGSSGQGWLSQPNPTGVRR